VNAVLGTRCVTLTAAGGRPASDRVWQECFAQLVGTILSLWDASELDNVKSDTEVLPTFINLTDAAIHMVCHSMAAWNPR
jgi:CCR4-NOT transcriptional complex subunit CAF120